MPLILWLGQPRAAIGDKFARARVSAKASRTRPRSPTIMSAAGRMLILVQETTLEEELQDPAEPVATLRAPPELRGARRAEHRVAAGQDRDAVPAARAGRALERLEADRALELVQSLA